MKKRKKILVVGSSNIDFVLNVPEMPRKGVSTQKLLQ